MKKIMLIFLVNLMVTGAAMAQVGINNDGTTPNTSAMLDVKSTDRGFLPPRMTTYQRNTIGSPATGLVIYNTECNDLQLFNGMNWVPLGNVGMIGPLGTISGDMNPCPNTTGLVYSVPAVSEATGYHWTLPAGTVITAGLGSNMITVTTGQASGRICVFAHNDCFKGGASCSQVDVKQPLAAPLEGNHQALSIQIYWFWNTVEGATGYKWNTTNNYETAEDMGPYTIKAEYNLPCNTLFTRYVWAYSSCGHSAVTVLTSSTWPDPPPSPGYLTCQPFVTQINWNWLGSTGATGYKWNTTNNYTSAEDLGMNQFKTETGLACNTSFTRYVWAYGNCGVSEPLIMIQSTLPCVSIPTVTTSLTSVYQTLAIGGGNVTADGGAEVTARGVCWNFYPGPTLSNNFTNDGNGLGIYSSFLSGLIPNTTYFLRAYATNSAGTAYGNEIMFRTESINPCYGAPFISYDGKTYNTIQIGTQCWMAENLNVGTRINGSQEQTNNSQIEKYCYNDLESNCDLYGGLYQWGEMVQYLNGASNTSTWNPAPAGFIQGICPTGWHTATDAEWCTLTQYVDPTIVCSTNGLIGTDVGAKMKEAGTVHWASPNTAATNSSGFTVLPGGYRQSSGGTFSNLGQGADFWPASDISATQSFDRYFYYNRADASRTPIRRLTGIPSDA